jgi:hypothetical protein
VEKPSRRTTTLTTAIVASWKKLATTRVPPREAPIPDDIGGVVVDDAVVAETPRRSGET